MYSYDDPSPQFRQKPLAVDVVYPDRDAAERARFDLQFNEPDKYRYKVLAAKGGFKILITAQPGTLGSRQTQPVPLGYVQERNPALAHILDKEQ